jgi:hypothetical protein
LTLSNNHYFSLSKYSQKHLNHLTLQSFDNERASLILFQKYLVRTKCDIYGGGSGFALNTYRILLASIFSLLFLTFCLSDISIIYDPTIPPPSYEEVTRNTVTTAPSPL